MTRQEAEEKGNKLLSLMDTPGWKVNIWHNGHVWCFSISKKNMTIYKLNSGFYYVNLDSGPVKQTLDDDFWDVCSYFSNPNDAVKEQIKKAKEMIKKLQKIIKDF